MLPTPNPRPALPPSLARGLSQRTIPELDAIRAIAVILVMLFHFGLPVRGAYGVTVFFVLSGFLITWLLLKEVERTGTVSFLAFYKRRTLRIFPAFYAFMLAAVIVILFLGYPVPWANVWASSLYVSDYQWALGGAQGTWFDHTWSLGIEEQFYLMWPGLAWLILQKRPARLGLFVTMSILAVWVWRALLVQVLAATPEYLYAAFDTRADALMVGALLAIVLHERRWGWLWRKVLANQWMPVFTVAALAVIFSFLVPSTFRDLYGHTLAPPLIAIGIVQLVAFSGSRLWRWTQWGWITFLGRLSYSMYLYQQVIMGPVHHGLGHLPLLVQLAVAISLTVLIASLSYYIIEAPFLRLKHVQLRQASWSTILHTFLGRPKPVPRSTPLAQPAPTAEPAA